MSTDRDTTRIVRSWLRSTQIQASADRVLDGLAVGLEAAAPEQRATSWPLRRTFVMSTYAKAALAAAVVVVAALLGYAYVTRPNIGGPDTEDSTSSPSASAVTPAIPLPAVPVNLDAGTYSLARPMYTPVRLTFDVPAGWATNDAGAIVKNPNVPSEVAMTFWTVAGVYTDGCDTEAERVDIGPTDQDLVRALRAQTSTLIGRPTAVTIGGYPSQRLQLSFPTSFDTGFCRVPDTMQVWQDFPGGWFAFMQGASATVDVIDVHGQRVVVTSTFGADASEEDRVELEGIVRSIRFPDEP